MSPSYPPTSPTHRLAGWAITLLIALLGAGHECAAQTNRHVFHNGVDYFFSSPVMPPGPQTTLTRCFGSATSIGNQSGGTENATHGLGIQQDGFEAWTAQATSTPSTATRLGFSLLEFRRGGTYVHGSGTTVASGSWYTSLPCGAPWAWIVSFAWGTTYTQTASVSGSQQGFAFSLRGEPNQTIGNQNYFLGSGNERNLNTGGISFFEDTSANLAFQVAANQEWSHGYFQLDAVNEANRDPSGALSAFGFDTATVGTSGTHLRAASTLLNPGSPPDGVSFFLQADQQQTGTSNSSILLLAARGLGGGLSADAQGSFLLPSDGRKTNLVSDPVLTGLALNLSLMLSTGGSLAPLTGDIGLSGLATTLPLDLAVVTVPAALQPLRINSQAVAIQLPSFSVISNADRFDID